MRRTHFRSRYEFDRQVKTARQLRAETLNGSAWITDALRAAFRGLRRLVRLVAAGAPRNV